MSIIDMFQSSFNIDIPNVAMFNLHSNTVKRYSTTYEEIKHEIVHGKLLHADETPVSVRGISSAYVWVFTNMVSVFYLFRPNREADFLKELLEGFQGVLVSDFYAGYDSLPCPQQKCLIHLIGI